MFANSDRRTDANQTVDALNQSFAVIEFTPNGEILAANDLFLGTVGYELGEVVGKHHRMFVPKDIAESADYVDFWKNLAAGTFQGGEFRRQHRNGKDIWLQATYNPIRDRSGKVRKVVKFALDITEQKENAAKAMSQVNAINRSSAVIEFDVDGTIRTANDLFLKTMGYSLSEIQGKHHSMFADPAFARSQEYQDFWKSLAGGEFQTGEYRRLAKGNREIFLQASYNPIFDPAGKCTGVVKVASDITRMVHDRQKRESVGKEVDHSLSTMAESLMNAQTRANEIASSSTETESLVQTVASAAEEFNASIGGIAESMSSSKSAVDDSITATSAADQATEELANTTASMTSIVGLIQDIASQINLLALNATIESARAGEAGKGFAVVANEVKSLASQVATATAQISNDIGAVQNVSSKVVEHLNYIKSSIQHVEGSVTGVATAVEEQRAVSRDISSNINMASSSVQTIANGIQHIAEVVRNANDLSNEGIEKYRALDTENA